MRASGRNILGIIVGVIVQKLLERLIGGSRNGTDERD